MIEIVEHRLPIMDIGIHERFRKDLGDVEGLARDFRETGHIQPIVVRPTAEDDRVLGFTEPYMLVAGGRRITAAMLNGWEDIKVNFTADLSPLERSIYELHENLYRKEMTWDEEIAIKAEIHRRRKEVNPGHTVYETARELKSSSPTISKDLALQAEIEKNPELAKAGSKKAAQRMVEMEKHIIKLAAQEGRGTAAVARLRNRLKTGDSRNWIRTLETASVDLLYSDPPWGIGYWEAGHKMSGNRNQSENSLGASEYDDSLENMRDIMVDMIPEMIRITKPTGWIVLHCGWDSLHEWTGIIQSFCTTHMLYKDAHEGEDISGKCAYLKAEPLPWVWYRPNSNNKSRFPELHAQNAYEYLLVVNRGEGKLLRQNLQNVLNFEADYGSRIHAMQKPLPLCEEIISRFTFSGYTVVDPFFGSGALLAAAAKIGRDFRGCELNPALLEPALGYVAQNYKGDI